MILLKISEIQKAMAHLLIRDAFDECYLEQAEVLTFAKLTMQGGRNPNWYDEAPADDRVRWKECKPTIFTYIKGDRTPTMMRISLKASAEFAEKYLRQGTKIVITGRIQTGSYTNKDGQRVYTTDVVVESVEFAESKSAASGRTGGFTPADRPSPSQAAGDGFMNIPDGIDEELPFN